MSSKIPAPAMSPLRAASIAKLVLTSAPHMSATRGALHYHFARRTGLPLVRLSKRAHSATLIIIAAFSGVCVVSASRTNVRAAFRARDHAWRRCS